jgi:hypothetical protein
MIYEIVAVPNGMIGGHYAVKDPNSQIIGTEFCLDRARASTLARHLNEAFQKGKQYGKMAHIAVVS